MGAFQVKSSRGHTAWSGPMRSKRHEAVWDSFYFEAMKKIRDAIRESKDSFAKVNGIDIWANYEGLIFRNDSSGPDASAVISFDNMSISGIKKAAGWNWVPNIPPSPLEKLAECAS